MVVRHPNSSSIATDILRRGGGRRDGASLEETSSSMEREGCSGASLEETISSTNDISHGGDDDDVALDNDPLIFQETANSDKEDTISTSLGINLEVVLEISHKDMLLDEISMLDM